MSFSGVTFVLFCFVLSYFFFAEATAVRSIILRSFVMYAPRQLHVFTFCLFSRCRLFRVFLYHHGFIFVWRVRPLFFSFRMVLLYLVTTGWIFGISLCENSINQAINQHTVCNL